jgi:hypothetical protein
VNSYTRAQQRALYDRQPPEGTVVRDRSGQVYVGMGSDLWSNIIKPMAVDWHRLLMDGPLYVRDSVTKAWSLIDPEEEGN